MAARSKLTVLFIIWIASASKVNAASEASEADDEFILVIGGQVGEYGDSSYISDAATLISPDPAGAPVPECIRNLTDFPLRLYGGAGAAIGGIPFVCGGWTENCLLMSDKCFLYNSPANAWEESGAMLSSRGLMGHAYSDAYGLALIGGYDKSCERLASAETTEDGLSFRPISPLPETAFQLCAVSLDESSMFVSVGAADSGTYSNVSYIYDGIADSWTRVADMPTGRNGHGCGAIRGGREVAVAGGATSVGEPETVEYLDSVEIYNVETDSWRTARNLPIPISDAASVQYKDTFLLVGGKTGGADLDTTYMYEPETDSWRELEERLPEAKNDPVAMIVSRSMFTECL